MIDKNDMEEDIKKSYKIEKQVEKWDLFAKLAPTIFLIICFLLLFFAAVSFETIFFIGMVMFSLTAVIWWFWTIFSIRHLVRTLRRASNGLIDVAGDLKEAKVELKELINEENNRR